MSFRQVVGVVRIHQWVKNLFIFLPAFFGQQLNTTYGIPLVVTFLAFSLAASAVYVLNDVVDVEADKKHPKKRNRPITSGALSKTSALLISLVLASSAFGIAFTVHKLVLASCILYVVQNILYSLWLKNYALLDISIISTGFLIRLFAGGVVAEVPVSNWMYIMTFLLAFLLALGKRRDDLLLLEQKGAKVRKASDGYSILFIDHLSVMLGGIIIVSYIMYTLTPDLIERVGNRQVYITSIFVFLGVLRYLQLELLRGKSGNPTLILLKDVPTQLIMISWMALFGYLLYF